MAGVPTRRSQRPAVGELQEADSQVPRALKARLKYLNFNWIHYRSLSKGVTDDDRDLRKSFLLGTHVVGWEEGLGVRKLFLA